MRPVRMVSMVCALLVLGTANVSAQEQARTIGSAELNAAVVERASGVEQSRAQLRALLDRGVVREIARTQNIDVERLKTSIGTLTAEELHEIAPLVQGVTTALEGGQNITITATTLIILLLLIIVIVLIAD